MDLTGTNFTKVEIAGPVLLDCLMFTVAGAVQKTNIGSPTTRSIAWHRLCDVVGI